MYRFLKQALVISLFAIASVSHAADDYPSRRITLLVPFAAGGAADLLARVLAQKMSASMNQPVVVDNRPGAGGSLGGSEVARAPADGYTLLLGTSSTHGINPWVYKLPYDVERDFTSVSMLGITEYAVVVNPKINPGIISIADLLNASKSRSPTYSSMGNGTTSHLASAIFGRTAKADFLHVPYKSQSQAQTDLLAGQVDFMIDNISSVLPQAKAGKLRILATTGKNRSPAAMGAPTMIESGVADYEIVGWFVLLAPAGTPESIVARLNGEVVKALRLPDVTERMLAVDIRPYPASPAETTSYMISQRGKFKTMVEAAGVKVQ